MQNLKMKTFSESENKIKQVNDAINLVKDKYRIYFYFGMKKIRNNETEKIIIDNDGAPFTFIWDKNCSNVGLFLNEHLYPLNMPFSAMFAHSSMYLFDE